MKNKKKDRSIKGVVKRFAPEKMTFYYITIICGIISGAAAVIPYYLIWKTVSLLFENQHKADIGSYALYIFITQVIGLISGFLALLASHVMAFRVEKNIRRDMIAHFLKLPIGYFENEDSGRLRRLIDDNASKTHAFIAHTFPDIVAASTVPFLFIILLFTADIRFALLCILGVAVGMCSLMTIMGPKNKVFMKEYMESSERLSINGVEFIRGMPIVKVFNQSVESFQKFYATIKEYDSRAKKFVNICRTPMIIYIVAIYAPTMLLGPLCILLLGSSKAPVALIINSVLYIIISMLLHSVLMRFTTVSEAKNVFGVIVDKLDDIFDTPQMKQEDFKELKESGIVFENVSFTYNTKTESAVRDLSFRFERGKTYALVGASGSGKSTVLSLIGRFYDINRGGIRIDGKDIRSLKEDKLLSKLAIVFQESRLLKTTLRENIAMGKDLPDNEILRALKLAQCEDILKRFDKGLDTVIGENGNYVSGGEAQRFAIARAFLRESDILLLDEATAFADPENEKAIQISIDKLKEGKTCIMIAHRLNAIKNADCIIAMKEGTIEAFGTHEERMKKSSYYKDLFEDYSRSIQWRVANG